MDVAGTRARNRRFEVRATAEDRQPMDRAVAASGTDLTGFVINHRRLAAQKVLADRDGFRLDPDALDTWECLNQRRARPLKGLRELMDRPWPFPGVSSGCRPPGLLGTSDRLDDFACRSEEQTIWLRKHARQSGPDHSVAGQ